MKIIFNNYEHAKIHIRIEQGLTNFNFGLLKNESHELDIDVPYKIAWHVRDNPVSNQEFDLYGYTSIGDVQWNFGSPPGQIP